jgi:flavin-dependent dehydrogenase
MPETQTIDIDVLVIGGGPAGSAAATCLARHGRSVLLLEKDRHPRFHIGESLLPANMPILERLGVLEAVRQIGVLKLGADFPVTGRDNRNVFRFDRALGTTPGYAFQVKREEFDELLFRHAAAAGVDARENVRVTAIDFLDSGVTAEAVDEAGRELVINARYVVDATGRDAFLGKRLALRRKHPRHQSAALFAHFRGVERRPGDDAGNISIYVHEHGWAWMIPLRDGLFSVGIVADPDLFRTRRESPTDFMLRVLQGVPEAAARMRGAEMVGNQHASGNYSYLCDRLSGPRWMMAGDAGAFVDPIFSTGVFLAMRSAERIAAVVDSVLRDPAGERSLQRAYEREAWDGLRALSWFILRFTTPAMRWLFANPRNNLKLEQAVISMLAGDVFDNPAVRRRLALFRLLYYAVALRLLPATFSDWRRRRRRVAAVFTGGTTSQDPA